MKKESEVATDFAKTNKKIREMAKDQGLTAINNRTRLFIHGKPGRRWWFADQETGTLLSAEYGIIDSEANEFLSHKPHS